MEFLDDLKANFRSWETDCATKEDADQLTVILIERHPTADPKVIKQWAYHWVGFTEEE